MIWKILVWVMAAVVAQTEGLFHQNDYHIVHDKIVMVSYNHTACIDPVITLFKYNDTLRMKAINATAGLPGVKKNVIVIAELYKFVAKAYRPFPINITMDVCEETSSNLFGAQSALAHSNFKKCPCPKGDYYLENYVLEEDLFPPHLPQGQYKLDVRLWIDDTIFVANGQWFGSIVSRKKDD